MSIHVPIKPIPVMLRTWYLYDMESGNYHLTPAHIICVSSYRGHAITFDLKIDSNGAIFSYLPATAFFDRLCNEPASNLKLETLGCINCPNENVHVSYWDLDKVTGYWPREGRSVEGKYVLSMDWPDSNELIHMFIASNGHFYFRPNHKLLISGTLGAKLPDYKKLQKEWIVE